VENDMGKKRQREAGDITPFVAASAVKAQTPSVVMYDPRYPHNVGAALRACSCFKVGQVWVTGQRVAKKVWDGKRIPREERMKGFSEVDVVLEDRPFDYFPKDATPVAVELLSGSENLATFEHPENPVYVFGPEDGGVPSVARSLCHRRVFIPTLHCTNLAAAVYLILYDRHLKRIQRGQEPVLTIEQQLSGEYRPSLGLGWPNDDNPEFEVR
jgi:tRNA(Leu) C34 or U34 (ribose-2'-O)-methylase TrmL